MSLIILRRRTKRLIYLSSHTKLHPFDMYSSICVMLLFIFLFFHVYATDAIASSLVIHTHIYRTIYIYIYQMKELKINRKQTIGFEKKTFRTSIAFSFHFSSENQDESVWIGNLIFFSLFFPHCLYLSVDFTDVCALFV